LISYTTRRYTLSWRMALIRGYLREWEEADLASIEGSSQRVQEDTQKFADGMQLIFIEILAAVFALAMFSPFLVSLGATVQPPSIFLDVLGYSRTVRAPDSWLLILAISMALCGVLVASSVSSRLVAIDMDNQKAEAACRKTLVHAEESVDSPSPLAQHKAGPSSDARSKDAIPIVETIQVYLQTLTSNYKEMFLNLVPIDLWNILYSRAVISLPYVIAAPKLFEPHSQVNLGDLQMLRLVFFDVFFALNAFAINWPKINELRATSRRLSEFEERIRAQWSRQAHEVLSPLDSSPRSLLFSYLCSQPAQPLELPSTMSRTNSPRPPRPSLSTTVGGSLPRPLANGVLASGGRGELV